MAFFSEDNTEFKADFHRCLVDAIPDAGIGYRGYWTFVVACRLLQLGALVGTIWFIVWMAK